jgi:hypothetical protein
MEVTIIFALRYWRFTSSCMIVRHCACTCLVLKAGSQLASDSVSIVCSCALNPSPKPYHVLEWIMTMYGVAGHRASNLPSAGADMVASRALSMPWNPQTPPSQLYNLLGTSIVHSAAMHGRGLRRRTECFNLAIVGWLLRSHCMYVFKRYVNWGTQGLNGWKRPTACHSFGERGALGHNRKQQPTIRQVTVFALCVGCQEMGERPCVFGFLLCVVH